jgi:methylphosphotriester-DNA--protein-cysteine methyltransferase
MRILRIFLITFSILFTNSLISQTVYTTKTGEKYHKENCKFLKYSKRETTIKKAKELGFKSCKVCKPILENTKSTKNSTLLKLTSNKNTPSNKKRVTAIQCSGKTKSGKRCKRKTKNNNGKCYQH